MTVSDESVALQRYWEARDIYHSELAGCELDFFNEAVKELASKEDEPKRLIDLGCGFGRGLGITDKMEVYGVDFSRKNIAMSHAKYPKAQLVLAALENLPFRESVFDVGMSLKVLQHTPHKDMPLVSENIKAICKVVMLEEGQNMPESFNHFNHNYEELFAPMILRKKLFEGTNPYTHFFLFVRERPK